MTKREPSGKQAIRVAEAKATLKPKKAPKAKKAKKAEVVEESAE